MAEPDQISRPEPRRPLSARIARVFGGFITFLLILSIAAGAGLWLRLKAGPVDLASVLPEIEASVSEMLPGARAELSGAMISMSEKGRAELVITGVRLIDDEERVFAAAPEARGVFSIPGLLTGDLAPRDVVLTGVSARMIRKVDGSFSFGFGGLDEEGTGDSGGIFDTILSASTETDEQDSEPQRLRLERASMLYIDRVSKRLWRVGGVDLSFWADARGMQAQLEAVLAGGRYGASSFKMSGFRTAEGDVFLSAEIDNAAPRDIADQISALDWLAAFDAPVDGSMRIGVDKAGDLLSLAGTLSAEKGSLRINEELREPFESAALAFDYDPASQRFIVSQAELWSDRASARGEGFVEVSRDEDENVRDVVAQLDLTDLRIAAPEALDEPLIYDRGRVTGRVNLDPFSIELGELRLEREPLAINVRGVIRVAGEDVDADLALNGGGLTVDDLMAHWPRQAAPGAREWMLANMETADIPEFNGSVRLGETEDVKFDFSFTGGAGHYLRPMPPIENAIGAGQVDLQRFALTVESASVTPEGGEPLEIGGSTFVIADLNHPDSPADIDLIVSGRLQDAIAIVDHEPLGFIKKLGVPLDDFSGRVNVRTAVYLPLLKDLLLEEVKADAEAQISDLVAPIERIGDKARSDLMTLNASTEGFSLEGEATIRGVSADLSWRETFATGDRQINISARATPDNLEAFGLSAPWFQEGYAAAKASISFPENGTRITFDADLENAGLSVEEIGWLKSVGEAASLEGAVVLDDEGIRSPNYLLDSRDLVVNGNVALTPEGDLKRFRFKRLQYRGAADARVDGRFEEDQWTIVVEGDKLDLTSFEDLIVGGEAGERTEAALKVRFDLDHLILRPELDVRQAAGTLSLSPTGEVSGRATGLVGGDAPLTIRLRNGPTGGEAVLKSSNAGALLRSAGFFEDGAGGDLEVVANIDEASELHFVGEAKIDNIVIHEDAKLEKVLDGADLDDLKDKMRDDGIVFDRVRAPFRFGGDKLTVTEAVAYGPSIGVNLSGDYRLAEGEVDIDGVFTPLYALNSLLGEIPLLGDILTGGEGQGLIAFTFSVDGPAEDPNVSVNPLSALTPGIFRNIFRGGGDGHSSTLDVKTVEQGDR